MRKVREDNDCLPHCSPVLSSPPHEAAAQIRSLSRRRRPTGAIMKPRTSGGSVRNRSFCANIVSTDVDRCLEKPTGTVLPASLFRQLEGRAMRSPRGRHCTSRPEATQGGWIVWKRAGAGPPASMWPRTRIDSLRDRSTLTAVPIPG